MTQSMTKAEMIFPKIGIEPKQFTDTHQERCYPLTVVSDLMDEWAAQEVAKERESHINMVKQIVELLGFAKCLNILDAIEKWQKEREEANKLVEALKTIISQNECCKEDYVISQIIKIAKQSLTEYEKL